MKQALIYLISCFFLTTAAFGQKAEEKAFEKIEINASTDTKQWEQHIRKNSKLPDSIQRQIPSGIYKVDVQFIINKMGDLGTVKAKDNPGYGLDKIAEKIISNYAGRWQPANQCGRNVNAYRMQTITFVINNLQSP